MRIAGITLLILSSVLACDDPTPAKSSVDLLTQKPWIFWRSMARMTEMDPWRDLPFTKPDQTYTVPRSICAEDDIHTYTRDGILTRTQGNTFCGGSTDPSPTSTWEFLEGETILRTNFGSGEREYQIETLSEDVLKILYVVNDVHVQLSYRHPD